MFDTIRDELVTSWFYLSSASQLNEEQSNVASLVTEEDLEHLYQLVETKDGGPTWIHMMDRSTPRMSYQAWRRDPKVIEGLVWLLYLVFRFSLCGILDAPFFRRIG